VTLSRVTSPAPALPACRCAGRRDDAVEGANTRMMPGPWAPRARAPTEDYAALVLAQILMELSRYSTIRIIAIVDTSTCSASTSSATGSTVSVQLPDRGHPHRAAGTFWSATAFNILHARIPCRPAQSVTANRSRRSFPVLRYHLVAPRAHGERHQRRRNEGKRQRQPMAVVQWMRSSGSGLSISITAPAPSKPRRHASTPVRRELGSQANSVNDTSSSAGPAS